MIDSRLTENWLNPQKVYSQQYVDELKAKYSWHTGTPTEEGWYLCAYGNNFYCANYWQGGTWKNQWGGTLLAYQKIEPYEASKETD